MSTRKFNVREFLEDVHAKDRIYVESRWSGRNPCRLSGEVWSKTGEDLVLITEINSTFTADAEPYRKLLKTRPCLYLENSRFVNIPYDRIKRVEMTPRTPTESPVSSFL